MHLLVVGGGSAGHVLPARPIIERYLADGHQVSYVGTSSGLEEDLVADLDLDFYAISAGKLRRYFSWANLLDALRVVLGIVQAIWLVLRLRPQVVFSKGGFVSFPVVLAAWLCRVPIVAHESDLSPGLANRLVKPFATTFCTSFSDTKLETTARVIHSGTPIRDEILKGEGALGRKALGIQDDLPLLVVTGGSLGAEKLNEVVVQSLPELTASHHVVHVVGKGRAVTETNPRYTQLEYVGEGWGDILAAADAVVSRAGANALFELLALRKLMLLIPLPKGASRGDQLENAAYAHEQGLAAMIDQEVLTPESLVAGLNRLLEQRLAFETKLKEFEIPDAPAVIVSELQAVARAG